MSAMKFRIPAALLGLLVAVSLPVLAGEKKCDGDATACFRYIVENYEGKGWLGVELHYPEGRSPKILKVLAESPAATAGLKAGDLLVAFNGARYASATEEALMEARNSLVPGNTFEVTIERGGRERILTVTAGEVPDSVLAQWIGEHLLYQHRHQLADVDPE
jgi:predicted metalloprotease with PDZ domain